MFWAVSGLYVDKKQLRTAWCISSSIMHHFSQNWQPGVNSKNDITVDEFIKGSTFLGI